MSCYECASKTGNDTCTDAFRKTIKTVGFDKRCRIMEMNGKVVSQGVVPKAVCTPRALSNVRKIFQLLKKTQNKSSTLFIVCAQIINLVFRLLLKGEICSTQKLHLETSPTGNFLLYKKFLQSEKYIF